MRDTFSLSPYKKLILKFLVINLQLLSREYEFEIDFHNLNAKP